MEKTHFGYSQVDKNAKASLVKQVFDSVAPKYDLMNDLMSFGIHRLWKRYATFNAQVKSGQKILDLAGGTGDLAALMAPKVGADGEVVLADINRAMLGVGRDRLTDAGILQNIKFVQVNAETLPFAKNYFDLITIAFGLRNVTDKAKALESMYSVLRPGGTLLVLEFSKPNNPLVAKFYDAYSFKLLPKIGELVAKDADSYQYLAESIRMHPDQAELKQMMIDAGFDKVDYQNLNSGVVALHKAYKF